MEALQERPAPPKSAQQVQSWPVVPTTLPSLVDRGHSVPMDVDAVSNPDDRTRRDTSVLSMEDLEAAETLEVLRTDSLKSSPVQTHSASQQPDTPMATVMAASQPRTEPLLSLLTSAHPLLSSAINGSMSAYTSSKSYSPRFRVGAEFVERHIGSPVANTVSSIGRRTGAEAGLRWTLQRQNSSSESLSHARECKRRKMDISQEPVEQDLEKGLQDEAEMVIRPRTSSILSLVDPPPAYDNHKSPRYEEHDASSKVSSASTSSQAPTWQQRLMITTSALGVAMSEESLRSLKYCLSWLRWANTHLEKVIASLGSVLAEWDQHQQYQSLQSTSEKNSSRDVEMPSQSTSQISVLKARIATLKDDILKTLKQVVDIVSKYAGGALPDNARNLVRRHLTSLPQRFRLATIASGNNPEANQLGVDSKLKLPANPEAMSAHRILVLAKEGLDMLRQVSGVVNDTITSAEGWCDRLGIKKGIESELNEKEMVEGCDGVAS